MNNSIDPNNVLRDSSGNRIGTIGYNNEVKDGWQDRGKIENDRYIDSNGNDQGWVTRISSTDSGSAGGGGAFMLIVILTFGIVWGIKWLIDDGKKGKANASRSLAIGSIFIPFLLPWAIGNGHSALRIIDRNGGPKDQKDIALTGLVASYLLLILYVGVFLFELINVWL